MDTNTLCLHNKFGHCKFQDTCRHRHVSSLCDTDNCEISSCDKRHPRICHYYLNYRRCKFFPCSYSHDLKNIDNEKAVKIQDYVADFKSEVCELKRIVLSNSEKINKMVLKYEKTTMDDMNVEIDGLKEKNDFYQLKLDGIEKEFHTYSQVVDILEKKICKFFSMPYPLVSSLSILQQSLALIPTSTPPTPPCSSKKMIPDEQPG